MGFFTAANEVHDPPVTRTRTEGTQLSGGIYETIIEKWRDSEAEWMSHAANGVLENRLSTDPHEEFRTQMSYFLSLIGKILKAMTWALTAYGTLRFLNGCESAFKTLTSFAKLCRVLVFVLWALVLLVAVGITVPFVNGIFKWTAFFMIAMSFLYTLSRKRDTSSSVDPTGLGFFAAAVLGVFLIEEVLTGQDPSYLGITHHLAIHVYHASIDKQKSGEFSVATGLTACILAIGPAVFSAFAAANETSSPTGAAISAGAAPVDIISVEAMRSAPDLSFEDVTHEAIVPERRDMITEAKGSEIGVNISFAEKNTSVRADIVSGTKLYTGIFKIPIIIGGLIYAFHGDAGGSGDELYLVPFAMSLLTVFWVVIASIFYSNEGPENIFIVDHILSVFIYIANVISTCSAVFRDRLHEKKEITLPSYRS